jgi:hypothetical protein
MISSNWKEVVRTVSRGPQQFILARIRCLFGGADSRAVKRFTVAPYVEETGGKIFRSNGSSPVD